VVEGGRDRRPRIAAHERVDQPRRSREIRGIVVRACTGLASVALVCILIAIGLSLWNHSLRVRVDERQQIINRGVTLGQISSRLASALVTVAVRDKDEQIMKLLAEHGISINPDVPNPPSRPPRP
jgi:predicted permease